MKKILSSILSLALVLGLSANAFAATTSTLTPEQQTAKDAFMSTYYTQWQTLVDLRSQTDKAVADNKAIREQIKTASKGTSTISKDDLAKIKDTLQKNKDSATQVKTLDAQRKELVTKWHAAVKATDPTTTASLADQIKTINDQITTAKAQIKSNADAIKPLKDQVKTYRTAVTTRKATLDPLKQSEKAAHDKLTAEDKARNALWTTYKADITNKDYASAATTFQSIIDAKKQILLDIQANTANLNNILAALKQA